MANALTPFEALERALIIAGSQTKLAEICGVGQPAVSKWFQSAKRLPHNYVLAVEGKTGVSRHLLRPDIYPPSVAATDLDPGDECGPILSRSRSIVAGNSQPAFPRKDVA